MNIGPFPPFPDTIASLLGYFFAAFRFRSFAEFIRHSGSSPSHPQKIVFALQLEAKNKIDLKLLLDKPFDQQFQKTFDFLSVQLLGHRRNTQAYSLLREGLIIFIPIAN